MEIVTRNEEIKALVKVGEGEMVHIIVAMENVGECQRPTIRAKTNAFINKIANMQEPIFSPAINTTGEMDVQALLTLIKEHEPEFVQMVSEEIKKPPAATGGK